MKILFLTNKFPYPARDGGAIATFNLIKGLAEAGHQVTVIAINTSKHYSEVALLPEEVASLANFHAVYTDTRISVLKALKNLFFSSLPYNAERFVLNSFNEKLQNLLTSIPFDIVQLEGLYVSPYLPIIRKYSQAKVVLRAHNVENEIWHRYAAETKNTVKRLYLKMLAKRIAQMEKSLINQYDLLVPITEKDAKYFEKEGNTKPVHISPTGFDFSKLLPNVPANDCQPTLFHIGGLDWPPNQQGLIWFVRQCLPSLYQIVPELKFVIAGRNAPEWFVRSIQHPAVEFVGEVTDAYTFIRNHNIMVVPLLSGSGMRIKIIEGLALGKCIVSTTVGAEGIAFTPGKDIFIADTASEFINILKMLISNPDQCQQVGCQAARLAVSTYDNRVIVENLQGFYSVNL